MPLNRLKSLNTKDCLWIYILSILKKRPAHAYILRKEIEEKFGFRPGTMTAYKVLYLLGREGYVESSVLGRKRVYRILPRGRNELKRAIAFYKNLASVLET